MTETILPLPSLFPSFSLYLIFFSMHCSLVSQNGGWGQIMNVFFLMMVTVGSSDCIFLFNIFAEGSGLICLNKCICSVMQCEQ